MSSAEILEWVAGWPWPVIIAFIVLVAGGIARIISRDMQDLSEDQSAGQIPGGKCVCQSE